MTFLSKLGAGEGDYNKWERDWDVFLRLELDFSKLRGQCYDGASNMSGRKTDYKQKYSKSKNGPYMYIVMHKI